MSLGSGWNLPPGCYSHHIDAAYGDAPDDCACCGVHEVMPSEYDADEDGAYVVHHDVCDMCSSMSCGFPDAKCRCVACGRRGVETCFDDQMLCVDCHAFRERSAAQLLGWSRANAEAA